MSISNLNFNRNYKYRCQYKIHQIGQVNYQIILKSLTTNPLPSNRLS